MKKRNNFFRNEEISTLNQLTESLEESGMKLEESYKEGDSEKFNRIKKFTIQIQEKILEIVK